MIPGNSALITVAEEQQGHLPKWGHPRDSDIDETHHVPLCSTAEDGSYGLGSDEKGQYVEFCFATEMSQVVLSEQQHRIFDADRVITRRIYIYLSLIHI
eukprot:7033899-Pyramimonas_sp.AAC.1